MMKEKLKWIWIDKKILFDKNLNQNEKLILAQIIALSWERGCFATNEYFWEILSITRWRASFWINSLVKKWYLKVAYNKLWQRIIKSTNTIIKNAKLPFLKIDNSPKRNEWKDILENDEHNIISNNNIYNKYWEYQNVFLLEDEYKTLISIYKEEDLDSIINKLDKWIETRWYQYKNHFTTIIDWMNKAEKIEERFNIWF